MDIAVDVDALLAESKSKHKSTEVKKDVELQFDLGNLLATDLNIIDTAAFRGEKEGYLKTLMRDNVQLLINQIWQLPTVKTEDVVLAELPKGTTVLPREKPIPKPKAPTKWEQFAKTKGIKKVKKSRMVFDETTQTYKPRYGYKRVGDLKDEWIVEVPKNGDPYQDYFKKKEEEKSDLVSKNEYQRLRNIAKERKTKTLRVPPPPSGTKDLNKHQLTQALGLAKTATASVGKFTPSLPSEPVPKKSGKKRKAESMIADVGEEKARNLGILKKMNKKKEVLDVTKAVNTHMAAEQKSVHFGRVDSEGKEVGSKKRKAGGKKMGGKRRGDNRGKRGGDSRSQGRKGGGARTGNKKRQT
ncbi:hypothetical protein EMCRGX_G027695 [Ephydatia muelleri]